MITDKENIENNKYKISPWERLLVGKNIHSVYTLCRDCGMKGINFPFEEECGNCGSENTIRYYDKKTIDILFQKDNI